MAYDELMHYGILGMKWGVRRYQNEDGSLTNSGKKRYLKKLSDTSKEAEKKFIDRGNIVSKGYRELVARRAKQVVAGSAASVAIAAGGSFASYILNKNGNVQAAEMVYKGSKKAFNMVAGVTTYSALSAGMNYVAAKSWETTLNR